METSIIDALGVPACLERPGEWPAGGGSSAEEPQPVQLAATPPRPGPTSALHPPVPCILGPGSQAPHLGRLRAGLRAPPISEGVSLARWSQGGG